MELPIMPKQRRPQGTSTEPDSTDHQNHQTGRAEILSTVRSSCSAIGKLDR